MLSCAPLAEGDGTAGQHRGLAFRREADDALAVAEVDVGVVGQHIGARQRRVLVDGEAVGNRNRPVVGAMHLERDGGRRQGRTVRHRVGEGVGQRRRAGVERLNRRQRLLS